MHLPVSAKNSPAFLNILKRVVFTETERPKIYNLAFGDACEDGEIDDCSISDNGDRNKILATVVLIVDLYTKRFPSHWIMFRGSTADRTRLYRMAVGLHLEELATKFEIFGYIGETLVPFSKNMNINTFLVKRKIV
jgi:hypothetical protein